MKIKILFILIFVNLIGFFNAYSIENKILLKIDNEIITTIDVFNETNYLAAMNKKVKEMNQDDIYKISIKSLIKRTIKKIEIQKNTSMDINNIDELYLNELISNTFKRLGFNNFENFNKHLKNYGVEISQVKNIISIESLWNEIIYKKFSKKIKIDETKLKEKIIKENNNEVKSFLISEIIFKLSEKQNINQKFEMIKKDINEKGFSNAALLHSISGSSTNGGEIGWFTEKSLNSKIRNKIKELKIGEYSEPIIIPGGFLILKLDNIKKEKKDYDIKKKLKELIRISTNQQLNQLSNIYFEKVKKEIKIDEL
tara:strand:- start:1548 stop:2483 length:936 start_codon:yes stop_codon:yes gene_type:complete